MVEVDEDYALYLKRKKLKVDLMDEDYYEYLKFLSNGHIRSNDAVEEEDERVEDCGRDEEEEEDDGVEDPHLRMFLENLKADGKSFVLKVCGGGGLRFLKYEDPVELSDDGCESREEDGRRLGVTLRRRNGKGRFEKGSDKGKGFAIENDDGEREDMRRLRSDVQKGVVVEGRKGLGEEKWNLRVRKEGDVSCFRSLPVNEKRNLGVRREGNVGSSKSLPVQGKTNLRVQCEGDVKSLGVKEKRSLFVPTIDEEENRSVLGKNEIILKVERNLRSDNEYGRLRSGRNWRSSTDNERIERIVRDSQISDIVDKSMLLKEKRRSGFLKGHDADASMSFHIKARQHVIRSTSCGENLESVMGQDNNDAAILENLRTKSESEKMKGRVRDAKSRDNFEKKTRYTNTDGQKLEETENLRSEHLSNVSRKRKRCLNENVSPLGNDTLLSKLKGDKEDVNVDPCLKLFLNGCIMEGDSYDFIYNGKRSKYEEDNAENSSDSDIMVLDKAPEGVEWNYTPVTDSQVLNGPVGDDDILISSKVENPKFRREVMNILKRPFNQKEYEKLLTDVKSRKPIEGHVELRRGTKSFPTDIMGKSFLDHYVDLSRQLDVFKGDHPRKLNILRGFFYYLENISNDGKFKPWLDGSCLAVEPRCN